MTDNSELIAWLSLKAETPNYMPSVERQKYSDAAQALRDAETNEKALALAIVNKEKAENDERLMRLKNESLQSRIAELEADRKRDCCAFFRWFWNSPGTNAEQGYDEWTAPLT